MSDTPTRSQRNRKRKKDRTYQAGCQHQEHVNDISMTYLGHQFNKLTQQFDHLAQQYDQFGRQTQQRLQLLHSQMLDLPVSDGTPSWRGASSVSQYE